MALCLQSRWSGACVSRRCDYRCPKCPCYDLQSESSEISTHSCDIASMLRYLCVLQFHLPPVRGDWICLWLESSACCNTTTILKWMYLGCRLCLHDTRYFAAGFLCWLHFGCSWANRCGKPSLHLCVQGDNPTQATDLVLGCFRSSASGCCADGGFRQT